ncbi:MAG: universal stress protein [Acidimicrobiia bacterium]|nr:universal stress protein [Acidimicrobiia bacterium]
MDLILIADDHSEASRRAVGWAARHLPITEGRVVLLNVSVPPTAPLASGGLVAPDVMVVSPVDDPEATDEVRAEALKALAETRDSVGLPADTELLVVWGDPATEIVIAGNDLDADLIVIGSRGRGFFGRMLLGSVSGHVVHHAHRPVLIVPPADEDASAAPTTS